MTRNFDDLTTEGKLAKIARHLETGHPVKASWVQWLTANFGLDIEHCADHSPFADGAFDDLDTADRLHKIRHGLSEGMIPSSWVSWLLDELVPVQGPTKAYEGRP